MAFFKQNLFKKLLFHFFKRFLFKFFVMSHHVSHEKSRKRADKKGMFMCASYERLNFAKVIFAGMLTLAVARGPA